MTNFFARNVLLMHARRNFVAGWSSGFTPGAAAGPLTMPLGPDQLQRLRRWLLSRSRSPGDVEDLIQESVVRLCTRMRHTVVVDEEAFVRRTAAHLAVRRRRASPRRLTRSGRVGGHGPLIAPGPTPEQSLDVLQQLEGISSLLGALNPRTRQIYFAHQFGYRYAEIAAALGIAEITVERHIARAQVEIANND